MLFWKYAFVLFFVLIVSATLIKGQSPKPHPDDELYHGFFTVKGKIISEDGLNYVNPFSIIFQRIGCKKCIVLATTNEKGEYEVTLYKGKYRIVSREVRGGFEPSYDLLAANQTRIIDVSKGKRTLNFDIKVSFPKR